MSEPSWEPELLIGTSWKMNKTRQQAADWIAAVADWAFSPGDIQIFVIPPFTALHAAADAIGARPILLGAQNVHEEPAGAYTGEISAPMLADAGCAIVEIGHSERRKLFGETDAQVARKAAAVLACGMRPLICIGEDAEQRRTGNGPQFAVAQAKAALELVPEEQHATCLLAYEPVWSIGVGGTPAQPAQIREVRAAMRAELPEVRVLYGGSVNARNAEQICTGADVDGLFVGRAALEPAGFASIIKRAWAGHERSYRHIARCFTMFDGYGRTNKHKSDSSWRNSMALEKISAKDLQQMFAAAAKVFEGAEKHLSDLDRNLGDGDHGITMEAGFRAVRDALASKPAGPHPSNVFAAAATAFLQATGGSAGPLYATAFMRAAAATKGLEALDAAGYAAAIAAMAEGIEARGKAVAGDKTMLDAWLPAAEAARLATEQGADLQEVASSVTAAAATGANMTDGMKAAKGRAARLGERSISGVDPGAASTAQLMLAFTSVIAGENPGY